MTTTAFLVDRKGVVHSTHVFAGESAKMAQRSVDQINPGVAVASGGLKYTLAEPGSEDYLTHIEKLFEVKP